MTYRPNRSLERPFSGKRPATPFGRPWATPLSSTSYKGSTPGTRRATAPKLVDLAPEFGRSRLRIWPSGARAARTGHPPVAGLRPSQAHPPSDGVGDPAAMSRSQGGGRRIALCHVGAPPYTRTAIRGVRTRAPIATQGHLAPLCLHRALRKISLGRARAVFACPCPPFLLSVGADRMRRRNSKTIVVVRLLLLWVEWGLVSTQPSKHISAVTVAIILVGVYFRARASGRRLQQRVAVSIWALAWELSFGPVG